MPDDTLTLTVPAVILREALTKALVGNYNDAPLAGMARAVVKASAPDLEAMMREQVSLVLTDDSFRAELRGLLRGALREAALDKAKSVMRSLSPQAVLDALTLPGTEVGGG